MAHGGFDKFWAKLLPSQGVRVPSTKKVEFRDADLYIYSAAASTLDIVNARTSTKTVNITGNTTIGGTTTLAGGNITASGTRHIAFRAADQYIYSSAASTLDIMNDGTTTKAVNLKGTLTLKGGNTTASGTRHIAFRAADQYLYSPSASVLNIMNDGTTTNTVNIKGATVLQGGNTTASGTRAIQFRAADIYAQSSAASVLNIVIARTSGSIRVGGTANYAQFKEDGEVTLAGNAQVKKYFFVPALTWDVTDTSACYDRLNSKYPVVNINPSAVAADVYIYATSLVPDDAAAGCNMVAFLETSTRVAAAGSTALRLKWNMIADGETTGTTGSSTVPVSWDTQYERTSTSLSIVDHPVQDDAIGWTLQYTGSGTNSGSKFDVWGVRVRYIADRLGNAV